MIDVDDILSEVGAQTALWCMGGDEDTDLVAAAEYAVGQNLSLISVVPDAVGKMWPWLEKTRVDIVARLYLNPTDGVGAAADISDLATRINMAFKQGAAGAQVFVKFADLNTLVDNLYLIRDDLFFNKTLALGLDVADVNDADWPSVFAAVRKIRASGLILALGRDMGDRSDFVGRVYGALRHWNADLECDLQFAPFTDFIRMNQAYRLVQQLRPKLLPGARFFVKY